MNKTTVRLLDACARLRWKKTRGSLADAVRAWQANGSPRDPLEQSTFTLLRRVRDASEHTSGRFEQAVKRWHDAGSPDVSTRRTYPPHSVAKSFGNIPCPSCETLTDLRVCPKCSCIVRG